LKFGVLGQLETPNWKQNYDCGERTRLRKKLTFDVSKRNNMKREKAIEAVNELPKEFDLDKLFERLLFIEKVEKGLKRAKQGKTISHKKVMNEFRKKWEK